MDDTVIMSLTEALDAEKRKTFDHDVSFNYHWTGILYECFAISKYRNFTFCSIRIHVGQYIVNFFDMYGNGNKQKSYDDVSTMMQDIDEKMLGYVDYTARLGSDLTWQAISKLADIVHRFTE